MIFREKILSIKSLRSQSIFNCLEFAGWNLLLFSHIRADEQLPAGCWFDQANNFFFQKKNRIKIFRKLAFPENRAYPNLFLYKVVNPRGA